jgi:hypothetical protein
MSQSPPEWIDVRPPVRYDRRRTDHTWLGWFQIAGIGLLLAYPVVTLAANAELQGRPSGIVVPLAGSAEVFLGFVFIGAGFRAAGGVFRGALAGAAMYLVLSALFLSYSALRFGPPPDLVLATYFSLGWPVMSLMFLVGGLGN